jgi:hypothetical protein
MGDEQWTGIVAAANLKREIAFVLAEWHMGKAFD